MATLIVTEKDCIGRTIGDIVTVVYSTGDYFVGEICKLPKPYNPMYIIRDGRNGLYVHVAEEDIH